MSYPEDIQSELDRARRALEEKNEGKARVCCRRAAGAAIRRWLASQTTPSAWGQTAITQLRTIAEVGTLPAVVRGAAARLSTGVAKDHSLPFEDSPIEDALIIVKHFAG